MTSELFVATQRGNIARLTELLDAGADPNEKDDSGYPPLCHALNEGDLGTAQFLIDNGAEIQIKHASNGDSFLHILACNQILHPKMLKEVITFITKEGIELDIKNKLGDTPMHTASLMGIKANMEALTELGADPKATNNRGDTPEKCFGSTKALVDKQAEFGDADVISTLQKLLGLETGDLAKDLVTMELLKNISAEAHDPAKLAANMEIIKVLLDSKLLGEDAGADGAAAGAADT
jgi:hypothetical protein